MSVFREVNFVAKLGTVSCNHIRRSLPNWSNLQAEKVQHLSGQDEGAEEEESPEEVRQRNVREAEILAGNLGDSEISIHEILSDVAQLRGLAQLQESMVGRTSITSTITFSVTSRFTIKVNSIRLVLC